MYLPIFHSRETKGLEGKRTNLRKLLKEESITFELDIL